MSSLKLFLIIISMLFVPFLAVFSYSAKSAKEGEEWAKIFAVLGLSLFFTITIGSFVWGVIQMFWSLSAK